MIYSELIRLLKNPMEFLWRYNLKENQYHKPKNPFNFITTWPFYSSVIYAYTHLLKFICKNLINFAIFCTNWSKLITFKKGDTVLSFLVLDFCAKFWTWTLKIWTWTLKYGLEHYNLDLWKKKFSLKIFLYKFKF